VKVAILGWGSLLWDQRAEFDAHHEAWKFDGPSLKLEFSRISRTRFNSLTLVLDYRNRNGNMCQVAYALSKRNNPDDAICDLRCREGTVRRNIGFCFADGSPGQSREEEALKSIRHWASENKMDVVIWTDLASNFQEESRIIGNKPFSIEAAVSYIQALNAEEKSKAAEYVWRAPEFIDTPLRRALQSQPWFQKRDSGETLLI
jgi:hypothetical protein